MARKSICFLICVMIAISTQLHAESIDFKPLYQQLRNAIDSIDIYDAIQQEKISKLKEAAAKVRNNKEEQLLIDEKLFKAYYKFCYDSTIVYIDKSIALAEETGDKSKQIELKMHLANYYGKGGSFTEAMQLIEKVEKEGIPEELKSLYYDVVRGVYDEAAANTHSQQLRNEYYNKSNQFQEFLFEQGDSMALNLLHLRELKARQSQDWAEAIYCSDCQIRMVAPYSPEYSEATYFRAYTYGHKGDKEMQKYWLIQSALGDLRNSIKDQASLWSLAKILANEGNTELSYYFTRTSYDILKYYNAPLRYLQIVDVLSTIDQSYQTITDKQNDKLRISLWAISTLVLLLLGATFFIYRQVKRLKNARLELQNVNDELKSVNNDLKMLNKQLNTTVESLNIANSKLTESNTVKDVYIGRFLSQCSEYMRKMDSFRSTVLKKAKSGQLEDYLSKSRMREIKNAEISEFTEDFDKAFLHIIPTFIEEFNALIKPEYRVTPDEKMALTTEQRIFALIRLGINDSSKIAEFLHYSVQTIYNYRSAVKNNAICERNEFEDLVRKIGSSSK